LLALQDALNIRDESAFKTASSLGGGIGGRGDVCGSLLGACLMLGLTCGCTRAEAEKVKRPPGPPPKGTPPKKDDPTYMAGELYKWFKKEFGSVKCRVVRKKHEREVDEDSNNDGLSPEQRMFKVLSKCDALTGKTASKAVMMICEAGKMD